MSRNRPGVGLRGKLIGFVVVLVLSQIGIMGLVSTHLVEDILDDQLGKQVLNMSNTVARMPEVARLIHAGDPERKLQRLAESIRISTGAQFVVIGDKHGIRYSHPDVEKIGQHMVGGDNDRALKEGLSYLSRAVGTLGLSLRGKAPVRDAAGKIVGIVSVGYLAQSMQQMLLERKLTLFATSAVLLLVGIACAVILAGNFKRAIFGLEPDEIARMFQERSAILSSIREGIVAINSRGQITMLNRAAKQTLGLHAELDYSNRSVSEVIPDSRLQRILRTGKSELDIEHQLEGKEIIVNRMPIWNEQRVVGVVSSFREKDEIDQLARELSRVHEYSELLRQRTHEYSNKLHTISGLIQLEAYDSALELIVKDTSGYQGVLQFLTAAVADPVVAGCILGLYNRARELEVSLHVDRESSFRDVPQWISRDRIVSILGNLVDNAFQAVARGPAQWGQVHLALTDLGNDLIIEVEDNGAGIAGDIAERIFEKGVTTSVQYGRGMGLFLVKDMLEQLGGHITVGDSPLGGVAFTAFIPKERPAHA